MMKLTPKQAKICLGCPKRDKRQTDTIYCGMYAYTCKSLRVYEQKYGWLQAYYARKH